MGTSYLYDAWCLLQPHRATFWFYLTPDYLQGRAQTSYSMPAPKWVRRGTFSQRECSTPRAKITGLHTRSVWSSHVLTGKVLSTQCFPVVEVTSLYHGIQPCSATVYRSLILAWGAASGVASYHCSPVNNEDDDDYPIPHKVRAPFPLAMMITISNVTIS